MKYLLLFLVPAISFAETWDLKKGSATYEIKHLVKKVSGTSNELKGKIQCEAEACEFLIAAAVKSFTSSDANRDENMLMTVEASKYPLVVAKGKFNLKDTSIPVEVEFHGKKYTYQANIKRGEDFRNMTASMSVDLDKHAVEKPSLFGVSIDEKVAMTFEMNFQDIPK